MFEEEIKRMNANKHKLDKFDMNVQLEITRIQNKGLLELINLYEEKLLELGVSKSDIEADRKKYYKFGD